MIPHSFKLRNRLLKTPSVELNSPVCFSAWHVAVESLSCETRHPSRRLPTSGVGNSDLWWGIGCKAYGQIAF